MEDTTILIIEDDSDILEVLSLYVQNAGYHVLKATTIQEGLQVFSTQKVDLMLVDINLPDGNGSDLAIEIRKTSEVIIFFITANNTVEDKLQGFDVGADDYITKPFVPKEVIARIKAHLNRKKVHKKNQLVVNNDILIDFEEKTVYKQGKELHLFTKEKQILFYLVENQNQVLSVEQIINQVWGYDEFVDLKAVTVHISMLRKKIESNPTKPIYIQTVRGFGYKFELK
ncbi:DNA-binding response regulator [Lysinibacillus sp. 2017]|uniref:response regulator transcription factor n=1 Tax=unclassified Lysinibacillus TaxID=2636778 RepID=UPI000D529315|nr:MULTISPECIES: response regulator transcription factor [unclassified Lysinibacillus]AWE08396.1 DNA-binding response regulator [Lysinibacillus sp. 2017]TGN35757.1 response regulator transcription factor [Lysinibacillus sp. S2017]